MENKKNSHWNFLYLLRLLYNHVHVNQITLETSVPLTKVFTMCIALKIEESIPFSSESQLMILSHQDEE